MLADLLVADGHRVVPAADGDVALGLFRPGDFDIVVMDLAMPGLTGLELIQALRQRDPVVAIVVITGWGGRELERIRRSDLVDLTATKPLDLPTLRQILGKAAASARLRREGAADRDHLPGVARTEESH
jgi:CheY-like chemotaxis protein